MVTATVRSLYLKTAVGWTAATVSVGADPEGLSLYANGISANVTGTESVADGTETCPAVDEMLIGKSTPEETQEKLIKEINAILAN